MVSVNVYTGFLSPFHKKDKFVAIVSFADLLRHASQHRYALSIVPVSSLTTLDNAMMAAHSQSAPLILAPNPSHRERTSIRALHAACEAAAGAADVPVSLFGYQAAAADSVTASINLGCNAIHITPTRISFPDAVAQVKELAAIGRACGISAGSVLPPAPSNDNAATDSVLPSVAECIAFAERTGIHFLEMEIGANSENGKRRAKLDYDRLRRVHEDIAVPILARLESDILPEQIYRLLECGVALAHQSPVAIDANAMEERFKAWGAAGRAAEVLAHCRPWELVEHVIEFNVQLESVPRLNTILETGRQRLANIPGVRRVRTGEAIIADAKYRYCWLVTFANEKVVAYYRDHPIHVDFANGFFRPIAGDRVTLDFRTTE